MFDGAPTGSWHSRSICASSGAERGSPAISPLSGMKNVVSRPHSVTASPSTVHPFTSSPSATAAPGVAEVLAKGFRRLLEAGRRGESPQARSKAAACNVAAYWAPKASPASLKRAVGCSL